MGAVKLIAQQQLRRGRQSWHQAQALTALTSGIQNCKFSPAARLLSSPEVGGGAIRREVEHSIQQVQGLVLTKEGGKRSQQCGHGPCPAETAGLLVGLLEGAHMHRHQEPSDGGHAAFLGARDLPLLQPPLHAAQRQRHQRRHLGRRLCGPRGGAHTLEPSNVVQWPALVHRQVHRHGVFWWAPHHAQDRNPCIIDELRVEEHGEVCQLLDQLVEGPVHPPQH
mmetsp:Transcript_98509/g.234552  ORF Transcript_98509/g.234552 Transcript_98509/m.234552 type:complete len:223 (-) Transcript_98509:472-1140(-)